MNVFAAADDPSSVFGLVIKSTSSDVLEIPVVDDIETFAVVGGILLTNALVLVEGLVVEEFPVGFRALETKLIGVETSEVSVVTAALAEDVSFVGGSVLLLCVVSASSEIAVVAAETVVDVSSVGGTVLLLVEVSASG